MANRLPEKLSTLRKYFSFAQMDVASKIGVPVSEYMKWENGNSVCGIEELRRIAKLYDVSVEDLFINDRELKLPDVELPYASVEIPFVEQTAVEEENNQLMEDTMDLEDTIETTRQIETQEDLGRTRVIGTEELQETTVTRIQEEPRKQSTKQTKSSKKMDPKTIGIIAGVAVVLLIAIIFGITKLLGNKDELSLSVSSEGRLVAGDTYSAYVTSKGKVVTYGSAPSTTDFENIVQIASDGSTLIGLKKNGTLVSSSTLPSEVSKWKNITYISMSDTHYVGVTSEYKVECTGNDDACAVEDWSSITKVYAGSGYTIGVNSNGKLVVSGDLDIKDTLEGLTSVKSISIGDNEIAVLFTSGKVSTYSTSSSSATNTSAWSNITAVAVGNGYVVGITDKETVVVATTDDDLTKEASSWAGIKFVAANNNTIIAVNSSDQVIGAGDNTYNQYNNLDESTPTPSPTSTADLPKLSSVQNIKFTVSSTGVAINWDSVVNANYYEVSVNTSPNEIKIKAASNSASVGTDKLTDGTTYTVTITAYPKDTDKYASSEATTVSYTYEALTKKLDTPTNVKYTQDGTTMVFTWDTVNSATSYVFTNGNVEQEVTSNSIKIDATGSSSYSGTAYISAKSSDSTYEESDSASVAFTYTAPTTPLTTPTITTKNVNKETGNLIITWTTDEHASGYTVTVGELSFTATSNSIEVKAEQLSSNTDYRIVITANPADTSQYSSSSYTENYTYNFTKQDSGSTESAG